MVHFLAINIGNTNTQIARGFISDSDRGFEAVDILKTDSLKTKAQVLKAIGKEDAKLPVLISSVVPKKNALFKSALKKVKFVDAKSSFSYKISVANPETVGSDRLVNLEAALSSVGAPCIVIDSGTATTFSVLNSKREFVGGAILPGLFLWNEMLAEKTAKLPKAEIESQVNYIGRNTREAIASGISNGYSHAVHGICEGIKNELGAKSVPVVVCGGGSHFLEEAGLPFDHFDSYLTLRGLGDLFADREFKTGSKR